MRAVEVGGLYVLRACNRPRAHCQRRKWSRLQIKTKQNVRRNPSSHHSKPHTESIAIVGAGPGVGSVDELVTGGGNAANGGSGDAVDNTAGVGGAVVVGAVVAALDVVLHVDIASGAKAWAVGLVVVGRVHLGRATDLGVDESKVDVACVGGVEAEPFSQRVS